MKKTIKLQKGNHARPFEDGVATMCANEYKAWIAGESHTDRPVCVSPILNAFSMRLNDMLDDEARQKLRPYLVRQIGTSGDGQDEARSLMALDWLIRTYAPAFLAAAGLAEEADTLRGRAAIESIEQGKAAGPVVRAASSAASSAPYDAAYKAAYDAVYSAAYSAASSAASSASYDAAYKAAYDAVYSAAYGAAYKAASSAVYSAVYSAAYSAASSAASSASYDAAYKAAYDAVYSAAYSAASSAASSALAPVVSMLQASAFELLDRMIDPGGIHDIQDEADLLAESGREALAFVG